MKYILLDANVTAGYYLRRSLSSEIARDRIENIFNSGRSGESKFFFYLPNFCIAEVFSVFMKYSFGGTWNRHVKDKRIDTKVYNKLVKQFQSDIHNGEFIYHYELSRYHVLGINLVAPVDHYFQYSKGKKTNQGKKTNPSPMGTFDHLIISMGIHLAHIHGADNVAILSTDDRLTDILQKCCNGLPKGTVNKLKLDKTEELTGRKFSPDIFPKGLNLKTAKKKDLEEVLGTWPLPVEKCPKVYRYTI